MECYAARGRASKLRRQGADIFVSHLFAPLECRCEICGTDHPGPAGWNKDHDHSSGVLRGWLCHHCNLGIGHFGDSIEKLNAAIVYLMRYVSADRGTQ